MGKKLQIRNIQLSLLLAALVLCVILCFSFKAEAEVPDMLETFFTEELRKEYFSSQVLAQLSVTELEAVRRDFTEGLGSYTGAELVGEHTFNVYFEKGVVEVLMILNPAGEIAGLRFLSVREEGMDLEQIVEKFSDLSGEVSLLVIRNDEKLAALKSDQKMNVGSTFKLAVLQAVKSEIESGDLSWEDVIELKDKTKSLPSGQLQEWPSGAPLTVHTLASLMISVSDNTATDVLIEHLGREKVESQTGHEPLLKTREFFVLKAPQNSDLLEKYRAATRKGKYNILAQTEDCSLPSANVFDQVRAQDIGWQFSDYELKELMKAVKDLELMRINPGVVKPRQGEKIAYKGGAQPGVLNYTIWLETESDDQVFITASWNDEEKLEKDRFNRLYQQLVNLIREGDYGD